MRAPGRTRRAGRCTVRAIRADAGAHVRAMCRALAPIFEGVPSPTRRRDTLACVADMSVPVTPGRPGAGPPGRSRTHTYTHAHAPTRRRNCGQPSLPSTPSSGASEDRSLVPSWCAKLCMRSIASRPERRSMASSASAAIPTSWRPARPATIPWGPAPTRRITRRRRSR